jgi:hypothetical protein
MTEKVLGLVALGTLIAGVAFGGYQYREVHLPEFEEMKAQVNYQACIQQCIETCRANNVPAEKCNCSHCHVYRIQ